MSARRVRAAAYARVSTEQQAQGHTVVSQVEALKERIARDGAVLDAELCFVDDGVSGETLTRPALERLRDQVAAGACDRLYVHSPDRLARKYAYVVLLVEEFRRAGVEVVFCNHELARTPEGELLLQVQGIIAEYERAQILERSRRGKRQAARLGAVSVFSSAPYGYRYVSKEEGGGTARFEVIPAEAEVVRQVYDWFVRDRLTLSAIARRLTGAGVPTRKGRKYWASGTLWRVLSNAAYTGRARYGRLKVGPRRPRTKGLWRPPPRNGFSIYRTPDQEQIEVAVPALVSEEVFALAQEQLRENARRWRLGSAGPRHLLQGLGVCQHCGRTLVYHGPGRASKRPTQKYYYRCPGLDRYRFGGVRMCTSRALRAEELEEAVWKDVCDLLSDPSRLEREFARRQQEVEDEPAARPVTQMRQRVQQSISRLIDAYQEGMLSREEFEPRLGRARQRLASLDRELAAAAQRDQEQVNFQEVVRDFRVFAQRVRTGLAQADLATRMRIVRWLVKRIEVDAANVRIIYKVGPPPFEQNRPQGRLQHHLQRDRPHESRRQYPGAVCLRSLRRRYLPRCRLVQSWQ
jgi:site-specific DNA recombinase